MIGGAPLAQAAVTAANALAQINLLRWIKGQLPVL